MRLLNTFTGLFEEFVGNNIPKYAILSHTWDKDEVSYSMQVHHAARTRSYQKIEMTCQLAREAGLFYAWVDTCCIDKSSSAELSEAINSMFRWYERAEICYAYLSDLSASATVEEALGNCRWFKRSWTLQELIAPLNMIFLDEEWNVRGSKKELVVLLSNITGIRVEILRHEQPLFSIPVATKMSWAADRKCTRPEDKAYSLLGIFDLNMPLLYGEEEKAFRRLQEEIIKSIGDLSIFAWTRSAALLESRTSEPYQVSGILADSITSFSGCGNFVRAFPPAKQELMVSNVGVKACVQQLVSERRYILPLYCSADSKKSLAIPLTAWGVGQFVRQNSETLLEYNTEQIERDAPQEGFLLASLPEDLYHSATQDSTFSLPKAQARSHVLEIHLSEDMEVDYRDAWSSSRCDIKHERYFAVGNDSVRDYATLKVNVRYSRWRRHMNLQGEVHCMFYALGWSSSDLNDFQCSLVDTRTFMSSVSKAQSEIAAWDHDTAQVLEILVRNKIPKSSMIMLSDPSAKGVVYVWFEPELVNNPAICPNPYWRVKLSVGYPWKGIIRKDTIPKMSRRQEKWRLNSTSTLLTEQIETTESPERCIPTETLDRGGPAVKKTSLLRRLHLF